MKRIRQICHLIIIFFFFGITAIAEENLASATEVIEQSKTAIQELKNQFPNTSKPFFLEGYFYYRAKEYEKAIEAFRNGLLYEPSNPGATQMIAFLHAQLNRHEDAVQWYKKTLEIDPKAQNARHRLGQSLDKLNRYEEARQAFEQELQNRPDNAIAHYDLANRYFAEDRLEEAKEHLQLAMKHNDLLPEPYYLLSRIQRREGNNEQAAKTLETFKQKKAEESEIVDQEVEAEKISDEERARRITFLTFYETGTTYWVAKRYDLAIEAFKNALEFQPDDEFVRFDLAQVYQEQGKIEDAAKIADELVKLNPIDPRYSLMLGLLKGNLKQWADAVYFLEKTLSLDPDNLQAKKGIVKILVIQQKNTAYAVKLMEEVTEREKTAENFDTLARAYFFNSEALKSIQALRQAVELEPNNPVYQERYQKLLYQYTQQN